MAMVPIIRCQICGAPLRDGGGPCPVCGVMLDDGRAVGRGETLSAAQVRAELDAANRLLADDQTSALAWHRIGAAREHLGAWNDARFAYERALSLMPDNTLIRGDLVALLIAMAGDGDDAAGRAAGEVIAGLERDGDPLAAGLARAHLAVQAGRFGQARQAIAAAGLPAPVAERRFAWIALAESATDVIRGRHDDAIALWERAAAFAPADTRLNVLAWLAPRRTPALAVARRMQLEPLVGSAESPVRWSDRATVAPATPEPVKHHDAGDSVLGCLTMLLVAAFVVFVVETWQGGLPFLFELIIFGVVLSFGVSTLSRWTDSRRGVARRDRDAYDAALLERLAAPETPVATLVSIADQVAHTERNAVSGATVLRDQVIPDRNGMRPPGNGFGAYEREEPHSDVRQRTYRPWYESEPVVVMRPARKAPTAPARRSGRRTRT